MVDIYNDLERQFAPVACAKALRYVLSNLVANAIRYTPRGEVRVQCSAPADGGLQLAVQDTGIGIPGDQLQSIFEDFNRLAEARRAHGEGFRLGLGIVRRLSTVLGFPVTVESAPGHGSTFRVEIPPAKVYRIA